MIISQKNAKTVMKATKKLKEQEEDNEEEEEDDDDEEDYSDDEEGEGEEGDNMNEDQKIKMRQLGFIIDKLNQLYSNHTSYRNYLQKAKNELIDNKGIIN